MKTSIAPTAGQHGRPVAALGDHARAIELGDHACVCAWSPRRAYPRICSAASRQSCCAGLRLGAYQGLGCHFKQTIVEPTLAQLAAGLAKAHLRVVGVACAVASARGWATAPRGVVGAVFGGADRPLGGADPAANPGAEGGETQANLAARSASASLVFFYNRPAVLATHL